MHLDLVLTMLFYRIICWIKRLCLSFGTHFACLEKRSLLRVDLSDPWLMAVCSPVTSASKLHYQES